MRPLAGILAMALAVLASSAQAASVPRGRMLVMGTCSGCHATGTRGASPNPAARPFRELSWRYPVEDLQEALAEGIVVGHPEMPPFRFEPADVDDIIAYLKSIQAPRPKHMASR